MAAAKDPSPSPPPSSSSPVAAAAASPAAAVSAASPSPSASPARSPSPLPLPATTLPPVPAPTPAAPAPLLSASSRRLPPPCWTHEETLALIDSYRDKWYDLRRGNLRASHWQEVADAVARRCARLPQAAPKTSVQCRHKVEKLRKRYRAERSRSLAHDPSSPPSSSWVYFRKMDAMERGPNSSSNPSPSPSPAPPLSSSASSSDDDDEDEDDLQARSRSGDGNTRSLHRPMANGGGLRFTIPKAVRSRIGGPRLDYRNPNPTNTSGRSFNKGYGYGVVRSVGPMEEMRRRVDKRRRREPERESGGAVATALQALGDGFMRVEQMKMEMAREMEKVRMEMELKRTEMVLDAQRRIVDAFVKGFFGSKKRAKLTLES